MTEETALARSRRKNVAQLALRELLHTMAAQADAGAPQGTIAEWTARTPGRTKAQTQKDLERLVAAGHAAKAWNQDRYVWTYWTTL